MQKLSYKRVDGYFNLLGLSVLLSNDLHVAGLDKEHAIGRIALPDYGLAVGVGARVERIGHVHSLVRVERLEHGHVLEQRLVHLALLERALEHNTLERESIESPQLARRLGDDGRGARHVVHERQLAERALLNVLAHFGLVHLDLVRARLDHVEVVAVVALLDYHVPGRDLATEHGVDHLVHLDEQNNMLIY